MGPMLWWWRWWTGADANRDAALVEARESIEWQQARVEELSSELEARDSSIAALRKELDESEGELRRLQRHVKKLEGESGELARLRKRITELERAEAETNRLRKRITELEQAEAETNRLRKRITELEQAEAETNRLRSQLEELRAGAEHGGGSGADAASDDGPPDVSEAAKVLGSRVELDDFTMIEGIGPKIASLLGDAGITTWRRLSETDPSELRHALTDAGPRFRMHDPANWPAQAALLAHGRWQEFQDLTTKLREQRAG